MISTDDDDQIRPKSVIPRIGSSKAMSPPRSTDFSSSGLWGYWGATESKRSTLVPGVRARIIDPSYPLAFFELTA